MITPKRTINENVTLVRERRLPISGKSFVKVGDKVSYDQCILATEIKGDIQVIRLSEKLGIDPDTIEDGLLVKVGQEIKANEVIFKRKGFFSFLNLEEISAIDGVVEFISTTSGHIGVRLLSKKLELKAFIPGEVKAIEKERTALIASQVGLMQGVVGYGMEGVGKIHFIENFSDRVLDLEAISRINFNEPTILAGGKSFSQDFFNALEGKNIIGIVTSSIDSNDVRKILKTSALGTTPAYSNHLPVVVIIEGFGSIPLSQRAEQFLKYSHGKLASINGLTQVRAGAIRPEIIVHEHLNSGNPIPETLATFPAIGDSMRIVRGKHFGKVGKIIEIPKMLNVLESGVETHVAILGLGDGNVSVSLANLESL